MVETYDVSGRRKHIELAASLGRATEPYFLRVRGSDGKHTQPGYLGASIDPAGPRVDPIGNSDPWNALWFNTNPIWVLPS